MCLNIFVINLQQLLEIRGDENILAEFRQKTLYNFRVGLKNEYCHLVPPSDALLPFGACICLWKTFFTYKNYVSKEK